MKPPAVAAHARERLGMEVQAVELVCAPSAGSRTPEVWSLLTEHGDFWLVERGGVVELFRATHEDGRGAAVAERRFLELHPGDDGRSFDCRTCRVRVTPRHAGAEYAARRLCRGCYQAERLRERRRERYRDDPQYRARKAAAEAARRRRVRQGQA